MNKKQILYILCYLGAIFTLFGLLNFLNIGPKKPDEQVTAQTEERTMSEEMEENTSTPAEANREEEPDVEASTEHTELSRKKNRPVIEETAAEMPDDNQEVKKPLKIIIASDTHYLDPELTDYGAAYEKFVWKDDGKILDYSSQLIDAFVDEAISLQPNAVILSGDLTLNGERLNHMRLAEKLGRLEDAGIQVLVIPGNHDINNHNASIFEGDERLPADFINAEEFGEIYHNFGYAQAADKDEASLSYLYKLDEKNWLLMIDSCQYDPVNLVGGKIKDSTYLWMEKQLVEARKEGALIIPIAHHNLLEESRLYTFDCTIEDNKRFVGMLEWWKLPVYFSGHLHLQRVKKHKFEPGVPEEAYSISEIVSNSLAIAPCQYGVVSWEDSGGISYETVRLNVSDWALKNGLTDENLLKFENYSEEFLTGRVAGQIADKMSSLPEEQIAAMSSLYGSLNEAYCAGRPIDRKDVETTDAYRLWERNLPDSAMFQEMLLIMKDTLTDHNRFLGNGEADYPE